MENTIRINRALPSKVVKDSKLLKSMAVFYSLKFLYVGGIVKNLTGRYGEIASMIGISQSNLRSKVKHLIELGMVTKDGRNLHFAGFNAISKKFRLNTNRSFRINHGNPKALETVIKALALECNYEKQKFKIKNRIVNEELKRYGKIEAKTTRNKIRKYIRKNIRHYAGKYNKRVSSNSNNPFDNQKINTDVTITRKGLAEMNGRKSKSTGTRLISKMASLGLLHGDSKRIERVTTNTSKAVLRHLDLDTSFFVFKNVLYRRKPNLVELSKFFA